MKDLLALREMPDFLERALGGLSAEQARQRGAGGTFAPVEQAWHLADLERDGYALRIRRLLAEDRPSLPDFRGDRVAEQRQYLTLSLAEGLRAFREAREATLALLALVPAEAWERAGEQEGVGEVALRDIPSMMVQHDAGHRAEIEAWLAALPR
jgi:hypothetical protein